MANKTKKQSVTLESLDRKMHVLALATDKKIDALADVVDDLARITKHGFDSVNKRFDEVDKQFELIDARLDRMDARIAMIEKDVALLRENLVRRDTIDDILARLEYLEKKIGVKV